MASPKTLARLDGLAWAYIYGGLVILFIGVTARAFDADIARTLMIVGPVLALIGAVMIAVRARLTPRDASTPQRPQGKP